MKRPLLSPLVALAAASLLLTGCGANAQAEGTAAGETISVEHAQGTTSVPLNPQRVYTFDLGVLDTLDALGVEVAGLPQANLPESLKKYESSDYKKIGSMKEPDFEAISEGAPDLIITSGRTADSYDELSKIAPTIDLAVDAADPLASFRDITATLGQIFQKDDEAADRLAALDTRIAETRNVAGTAGTGLIVMTNGGELTAYGAGSRFGIIHDTLGLAPAATVKADGAHGEAVSFEYLATTDPDHLFVIDRDSAIGQSGQAAAAVLDNELVNGTKAARNGNIHYLDSARWYLVGYGLGNVESMITEVHDALA